jgi:predicted negative regulator of RcsB-dependent stress response
LPPRPQTNVRNDYRSMVDAIQAGDVPSAQEAFARLTRGLPASAYDDTTTLGKIGATLDQGDLKSAQGILDGLESKAMKVLRAVQKVTESEKRDTLPPGSTFRITV